jgi:hypothetical protein
MVEEREPQTGLPIKHLGKEDVIRETLYANHFDLSWTLTDATIQFLQLVQVVAPDSGHGEGRFKPVIGVTLPWSQLKVLHTALGDLISRYEEKNGPLNLPVLP